jgi:TonB-linked SusC/RagA family outer membrane protein
MEVLRDAAATALYGSRGSAGVIVVTTKKGTSGKARITYDGQMGSKSKPSFAFSPMSSSQLLDTQESYGSILNGSTGSYSGSTNVPGWYYSKNNPRYATLTQAQQLSADNILDSLRGLNTNWKDAIFRNGLFSNHTLSISGGGERTSIYSSVNLYNEEGTTPRTDMNRIQFRNNFDYRDEKLRVSVTSNLGFVRRDFQQSTTTNGTSNPFFAWVLAPSYQTIYNADGTYNTGTGAKYVANNMLDLTYYDRNYNNQINANIGTVIDYKLPGHLTFNLTSGVNFRETQATVYGSKLAYIRKTSSTLTTNAGSQTESLDRFLSTDVRPQLVYDNSFSSKHHLNVNLVGEYVSEFYKDFSMTGYGIDPRTPNTPAAITTATATNQLYPSLSGGKERNRLLSGMLFGNYSYNDKYSLSFSYRQDGSSKLPKSNRWQGFYGFGLVWNAKAESFLNTSNVINVLRLRLNYGGSGNSNNFPFGNYGYLPTYTNGSYAGITTIYANNAGNADLKWEKINQWNFGFDYGFFNNRLYGDINIYNKLTKDLFVQRSLSATAGFGNTGNINVNAGRLQNRGFEWNVNYDIIKTQNLVWTVTGNGGYNKNKVLDLGGVTSYESGTSLISVGLPLGSHYEVKWGGVDQATGAPLYYTKEGKLTTTYSSDDAVQEFGTWESPWKGGFGSQLTYKGFGVSAFFSWQSGGTKVDNQQYFVENLSFLSSGYNQSTSLNFWKQPGDKASTPSPLYSSNFSSNIIHSTSFLRLRNVSMSYVIPKSFVDRTKFFKSAKIYFEGMNLFIWTKWRGMDPEAGATNINLSEYPNPRSFTGGLQVTF